MFVFHYINFELILFMFGKINKIIKNICILYCSQKYDYGFVNLLFLFIYNILPY